MLQQEDPDVLNAKIKALMVLLTPSCLFCTGVFYYYYFSSPLGVINDVQVIVSVNRLWGLGWGVFGSHGVLLKINTDLVLKLARLCQSGILARWFSAQRSTISTIHKLLLVR